MRSAGGTNFGLPCVVVAFTNSTIACLAAPSFHEGSGSVWAWACVPSARSARQDKKLGKCLPMSVSIWLQ